MENVATEIRAFLIAEAFRFVERAKALPGVRHIAIIGSLASVKADPKDADILVTVDDVADLTALATAARSLMGRAQSRNKGADVFLANLGGQYIQRDGDPASSQADHPAREYLTPALHQSKHENRSH